MSSADLATQHTRHDTASAALITAAVIISRRGWMINSCILAAEHRCRHSASYSTDTRFVMRNHASTPAGSGSCCYLKVQKSVTIGCCLQGSAAATLTTSALVFNFVHPSRLSCRDRQNRRQQHHALLPGNMRLFWSPISSYSVSLNKL